jgi:hypothetical protein
MTMTTPRCLKIFLSGWIVSISVAIGGAWAAEPLYAPLPPAPPIALSTSALEAATIFRAYAHKAADISPKFSSGVSVEDSLAVGSAYEPEQLTRGAIAYAALVALQSPTFVATFRAYAPYPEQRQKLADAILHNPRYAGEFPGASSAAGLIVATLAAEVGRMQTTGAAVKQSAYSVQHSAWSKTRVINPMQRLALAKSRSAALMTPEPADIETLKAIAASAGDPRAAEALDAHGQPVDGPYAPLATRALAVAALALLGEGGDDNAAAVQTLLSEPENGACLRMSKLNLYQCLAVAVPWYEDIFCLGEHALGETAQCIVKDIATPAQIQSAVTPTSSATTPVAPSVPATGAR